MQQTVEVQVTDPHGAVATALMAINLTHVNHPPHIAIWASPIFLVGGSPVGISPLANMSLYDSDSTAFCGVRFIITNVTNTTGDELLFVSNGSTTSALSTPIVNISSHQSIYLLAFSVPQPVSNVLESIASILYSNSNPHLTVISPRSVSVSVTDCLAWSSPASVTITILDPALVFSESVFHFNVSEQRAGGTIVGTVQASYNTVDISVSPVYSLLPTLEVTGIVNAAVIANTADYFIMNTTGTLFTAGTLIVV